MCIFLTLKHVNFLNLHFLVTVLLKIELLNFENEMNKSSVSALKSTTPISVHLGFHLNIYKIIAHRKITQDLNQQK